MRVAYFYVFYFPFESCEQLRLAV